MPVQSRTVSGPSSYDSESGFTISFGNLKKVKYVRELLVDGGYIAQVASISGNQVTIRFYYFDYDATADGTAVEVPNATDLSGVTVRITAEGL